MESSNIKYLEERAEWRKWLENNFDKEREIWLVFPNKSSGKKCILYNDAVEEALCFGWIDSTQKKLDEYHAIQRFTPRWPKSSYSQPNKERLKWLAANNMIHPSVLKNVGHIIDEKFDFPDDIIEAVKNDKVAWKNFQAFSDSYKRIRVAYIDGARKRPDEFKKRLSNFIIKTHDGKLIKGHGGVEKYY
jgi:uncharacterized protein YdeI (YjbR/CyaY-like superfamily)